MGFISGLDVSKVILSYSESIVEDTPPKSDVKVISNGVWSILVNCAVFVSVLVNLVNIGEILISCPKLVDWFVAVIFISVFFCW